MAEALSEQAAIDAIIAMDAPREAIEASEQEKPAETPETEQAAPESLEGDTGPLAEEQPEAIDEIEPEAEAEQEPITAPQWWDAEAKAAFENIPNTPAAREYARQMQAMITESEAKREAVVQKAKAEAQEQRQAASKDAEAMRGLISKLDGVIPDQEAQFGAKYGQVDWDAFPAWARQNPNEAAVFMAEYQADKMRIDNMRQSRAEAERVASETFAREQSARLKDINPELAGDTKALQALVEYLPTTGIEAAALRNASAEELTILHKAYLYDQSQKQAAASVVPVKPKTAPTKTVKPVSAPVTGTFKQRQAQEAMSRVKQSGSQDDAVAAIIALGL